MTKYFTILVILGGILFPLLCSAEASNAKLSCKSTTTNGNNITLNGMIPGDFAEFYLELKMGGKVIFMNDNKDSIYVITDFDQQVFTVAVGRQDGRDLLFYAVPNTLKTKGNKQYVKATFAAVLMEGPKPGYKGPVTYHAMLHNVKMQCIYEY